MLPCDQNSHITAELFRHFIVTVLISKTLQVKTPFQNFQNTMLRATSYKTIVMTKSKFADGCLERYSASLLHTQGPVIAISYE